MKGNISAPAATVDTGARDVLADIQSGSAALTASQIRKLPCLMVNGRQHDLSWVHRAFSSGCRAADGRRVRLASARTPGGRVTTREAVMRWLAQLNGISSEIRNHAREHANAEKRLAALGL